MQSETICLVELQLITVLQSQVSSGERFQSLVRSSDLIRRAIGDYSDQIVRLDNWTNDWKYTPLQVSIPQRNFHMKRLKLHG